MFSLYLDSLPKHANKAKCFPVCLLNLGLACHDYFSHPKLRHALGWVKTNDHEKTTADHPQADYGLFRICIS